ncbi:jacalin-related lectin 34-like [Raphanus sativus]|nr:jacalin-related lectin 34-like [Raphanus sativus]
MASYRTVDRDNQWRFRNTRDRNIQSTLLQVIGSLLRPVPSPDWAEILARILSMVHDRLTSILLRLAFQVTIYYIWRKRNERRHTQKTRPAHQLAKVIDKTIRQRILSTRYQEKRGLEGLMQRWFSAYIGQG